MTTKLKLWNYALIELGDAPLTDTGDVGKASETFAAVHDSVVAECLEEAQWNFSVEETVLYGDTGIARTDTGGDIYGYRYGFTKPSDWVSTEGVSYDEQFITPLLRYTDQDGILRSDVNILYLRYMSNDTGKGLDLNDWPESFTRYVSLELACRGAKRITELSAPKMEMLEKRRDTARRNAKSRDARNDPQPKFPPAGSWTRSRYGQVGTNRDGGPRSGNLTG